LSKFNSFHALKAGMGDENFRPNVEPGMKVAVQRGAQKRVGVLMRIEGEQIIVQWDWDEPSECSVHRNDVEPLDGWI
jgi:hypothetical protein